MQHSCHCSPEPQSPSNEEMRIQEMLKQVQDDEKSKPAKNLTLNFAYQR